MSNATVLKTFAEQNKLSELSWLSSHGFTEHQPKAGLHRSSCAIWSPKPLPVSMQTDSTPSTLVHYSHLRSSSAIFLSINLRIGQSIYDTLRIAV